MFSAFIRKLLYPSSKTVAAKARRRCRPRFVPGIERLEDRLNLGSASPTNVTAVYDATAHSLSVSFQQRIGSTDTPVYGAVFLDPAEPAAGGGITASGVTTSGSAIVTFPFEYGTRGLLAGQTVTGTGIQDGTTIASIDSSSQITLSTNATASGAQSLTFTHVLTGSLHTYTTNGWWTSGSPTVAVASTAGLLVGSSVTSSSSGIPAGTTITALNPSFTLTGNVTNKTNSVTLTTGSTTSLVIGQTVSGTGVPAGATISAINSSTQFTLSVNANATVAGDDLTFGPTITLSANATASQTNKSITFSSAVVDGLSSTAGLFVGQSLLGTGIPIPTLPTNPTQGAPEITTRIASIGADGHSITLTANATASGAQSLTFITGLALDGSGMEFVSGVIDTTTVFTQTYTYSPTYQNPFLLTAPPEACYTLYHNTGTASGFHSVVGDGPGLNTDNSLTNNGNNGNYQLYSGLLDYTISGKIDSSDDTPTSTKTGTLTTGSTTVTGLTTVMPGKTTSGSATVTFGGPGHTTTALFVGEPVTGTGIPSGTTIVAINSSTSITLSQNATATSGAGGTSLTFNYAAGLSVGEYVTGTGVPAGAMVASIDPAAGTITLTAAATTTGSQTLTFATVTVAGYRIINGAVDLNHDGAISSADTTSTLAGHPQFNGFNVVSGKVDLNGDGKIDSNDTGDSGVDAFCPTPTVINYQTDLSIAKSDGVTTVTAGDGVVRTYTITVTNSGPSDAQNVSVADAWPAGFSEGTITDAYGAVTAGAGGSFTAALGTLAAGDSKSITVSYTVPSSTTGDQTNTATVTSSTPDSNPANNTAGDTDHVALVADLAITKTDNSPTYSLGQVITYIITVTNNGPSDAVGATVADSIPAMLTGVSWTSSTTGSASVASGGSGSGNGLAATVNIAAGPGNSVIFTVTGTAPDDWCITSGDLVNTATVTAPPGITDPNPANNSATDTDTLSVGQSPITVNSAGDDPLGPSDGTVTFRDAINAVNLGTADAIRFAIPGTPTISLAADLPALDRLVYIDGTTQPGVTVNGNGFTMLDVASNVNAKDVSFNDGLVTVEGNGTLDVESDFNVGVSSTVNNYGSVDVCGSFLGGDSTAVSNYGAALFHTDNDFTAGDDSYMYDYDTSAVSVGRNFSLGAYGFVYNYDTSAVSVTDDFGVGNNGFVYNGVFGTDAATLSVGGNFTIGDSSAGMFDSGLVYNYGTSNFSVVGNFTIYGDGDSHVYNGVNSTDAATFTVGGNFSIGDSGTVFNQGASTLSVAGDFTVGNSGYVYNGASDTDAATLSVGGNFTIGNTSAGMYDFGYVLNYGASSLRVGGDLTIYGDNGSYLYNGLSATATATITVGGSFSLGANSFVYDYGTSQLSVTGNFTLGATSFFVDLGTMSVGGVFDPGTGDPNNHDIISGTFMAEAGSSVTTNTATWEVLAGGHLDVVAGATFTVANGGTVLVDGSVTVEGLFVSLPNSIVEVLGNGQLSTQGAGQLDIQGTLLT